MLITWEHSFLHRNECKQIWWRNCSGGLWTLEDIKDAIQRMVTCSWQVIYWSAHGICILPVPGTTGIKQYSLYIVRSYRHFFVMIASWPGNVFRFTALVDRNQPVTGEFPSQRSSITSFDVSFSVRQTTPLNEQSSFRYLKPPWCSYDVTVVYLI